LVKDFGYSSKKLGRVEWTPQEARAIVPGALTFLDYVANNGGGSVLLSTID